MQVGKMRKRTGSKRGIIIKRRGRSFVYGVSVRITIVICNVFPYPIVIIIILIQDIPSEFIHINCYYQRYSINAKVNRHPL